MDNDERIRVILSRLDKINEEIELLRREFKVKQTEQNALETSYKLLRYMKDDET